MIVAPRMVAASSSHLLRSFDGRVRCLACNCWMRLGGRRLVWPLTASAAPALAWSSGHPGLKTLPRSPPPAGLVSCLNWRRWPGTRPEIFWWNNWASREYFGCGSLDHPNWSCGPAPTRPTAANEVEQLLAASRLSPLAVPGWVQALVPQSGLFFGIEHRLEDPPASKPHDWGQPEQTNNCPTVRSGLRPRAPHRSAGRVHRGVW